MNNKINIHIVKRIQKHFIMKKLLILFAACSALLFYSCSNAAKTADAADSTASDSLSVEQFSDSLANLASAKDSTAVKDLLDKTQAQVNYYLAQGDTAKASEYASKVKAVVEANKETIQEVLPTWKDVVNKAIALPENVKKAAVAAGKQVADSANSAANKAVNSAVDAAKKQTVDKANKAVEDLQKKNDEAAKKANEKIENAQKKANDAVNKAVNKAASDAAKKLLGK